MLNKSNATQAVILVGGQGTRLRPLTLNTSKAMVPFLNRPFLEHMLRNLKKHGIKDVVLAMSRVSDRFQAYFGDGSKLGMRLTYSIEAKPLGTAGAVKNAARFLHGPFIVLNGDIITEMDLAGMLRSHRERGPVATIAMTPVDNPTLYGVIETDDAHMVKRFVEKPPPDKVTSNQINAGVYVLEPEVLNHIPRSTFCMFERDVFPPLLEKGVPILGYPSDTYWIDIGTPDKYLKAQHDLLRLRYGEEVRAEGKCRINAGAEIKGPVLIGRRSVIGPGVKVTGPAVIGPRCEIGEGATVEGAVLWEDVKVGKNAALTNCVVGARSQAMEESRITGGCVLGDGVTVGERTVLGPGTRIWCSP